MFNTELGLFCYTHDNWEELLTQEPYNLKISEDGPYVMFKYNQLSSDFNIPMVREARGIIFRKGKWDFPVCWPFNKFGNYGESYVPEINWETAFVSEKIDGSLIKVWWDGTWHMSTNGTIDAFKAELNDIKMPNFGTYFIEALGSHNYNSFGDFISHLDVDYTYMFELVGPYNRVVIPYEETAIYFLGARDKTTGEEFYCSRTTAGALSLGRFNLPKQYRLNSLEDCIRSAEALDWNNEGFVVCDAQFNRVKIKSPAYVMAHFARNNNVITRKHLISIIADNEIAEFLCYAEDYREELEKVQNLMKAFCNIGNKLAESCQKLRGVSRGTFASFVKTFPKIYQDIMFRNYEHGMTMEEYTTGWHENKWDEYLETFEKLKEELFDGKN